MGYITYKQADSRWGKKNYNGSSTMATAGCGPTSVAMLAYAVDGKTTPWDVAKYMQKHGYAIRNNGTAWEGIPAAMKAFGLADVKNVAKMEDVFKYLAKGYCAVFLFRAGSRGGITWTTSRHYVAVTDYKTKGGNHYLYTRDSGGRNHTGFFCYETQMRGLIPQVWVGKVPGGKPDRKPDKPKDIPTLPARGYFQIGDKGAAGVQMILTYLGFPCGAVDGIYGQATAEAVGKFQKKFGLAFDKHWGKQCNNMAAKVLGIKKKAPVKCIDVSEHQGVIDWKKVKASGINHVIIRAGYGQGNPDKYFTRNLTEAIKAGIQNIGVYWFMYSYTEAMAKKEAEYCIKAIAPYRQYINMLVSADWEYDSMRYARQNGVTPGKALITKMNKVFCEKIKAAGYTPAVYYNYDYKAHYLDLAQLPFLNWYALDKSNGKFTSVAIQQYGTEPIPGITGKADVNWLHKTDFIKSKDGSKDGSADTKRTYPGSLPDLSKVGPELIAYKAKALAWPYGTPESKYKYPSGSATAAFNSAIAKVFPNRSGWREQCRKGASCDVFVGTVVRASGHDTGFPRGLSDVYGHVKKKPALWKVIDNPSKLQAGDIVEWGTSSAGHIFVYTDENREAEANLNGKHYGHISKKYVPSSPKVYRAYRPIGGRKYLIQGDTCEQVRRLKKFLTWATGSALADTGTYDAKTAEVVRTYQKQNGLTPDGVFGLASLAKAKELRR